MDVNNSKASIVNNNQNHLVEDDEAEQSEKKTDRKKIKRDSFPDHIKEIFEDDGVKFKCEFCKKIFKSRNQKYYHLYCNDISKSPYKCKTCYKVGKLK